MHIMLKNIDRQLNKKKQANKICPGVIDFSKVIDFKAIRIESFSFMVISCIKVVMWDPVIWFRILCISQLVYSLKLCLLGKTY